MSRALITGAASGIGAATARRFKKDGAQVAGLDLSGEQLDQAGLDAAVVADVSSADEVQHAIAEAARSLGGLDVVVSCAGVAGQGTVADTPLDEWERIFAVNVRGVFLTARAAIPHLREAGGGAIVNVASQLGLVAVPDNAAYCASKGAVVNLTRAMAIDHAPEGIRVNAVCPGPTWTPLTENTFAATADPAAMKRTFEEMTLNGRMIEPEEIADAIAYLASPGATSTIGEILVVDGGYSIR